MALTTGIGNNYVLAVNLLCVMYQTAVLEFYFENLLVQSYNAPNRLLFKTTLKPLQGACISYLNCLLASSHVQYTQ